MLMHEKIARLAEAKRFNQSELAREASHLLHKMGREAGVSTTSMHRYWNGQSKPDVFTALAIARALGTTLDYLADDSQSEPPVEPDPALRRLIENAKDVGYEEANRRILNYGIKPLTEFRDPHRPARS